MSNPTPEPNLAFSLGLPTSDTRVPVLVEVPHAGLAIDTLAMGWTVAPVRSLGRDADLHVDRLCSHVRAAGATLLVSHTSRIVCDLNRAPNAFDLHAAVGGPHPNAPHGLFWHRTTEGAPTLRAPLSKEESGRRLRELYAPYHHLLRTTLERLRQEFGYAILLSAHSMPSPGRGASPIANTPSQADIVPGSRGYTTAAASVIDCPAGLARARGWTVKHDDPYPGGFTTACYGRPQEGVHAVQIEISRHLYMDEHSLALVQPAFDEVRRYLTATVVALGELPRAALRAS